MTALRRRVVLPLVVVLAAAPAAACSRTAAAGCATDALATRSLAELDGFAGWARNHGVSGTVGEVGWPAGAQWQSLAGAWYDRADADGTGVYAWSAAQWWPADYPLAIYRGSGAGSATFVDGEQAAVVQAHTAPAAGAVRGVAVADATFGASLDDGSRYSSTDPGVAGTDYSYPSRDLLTHLARSGTAEIRLGVMWERLQPRLGEPLDPAELGRLTQTLDDAAALGLGVVLDLHNYGRYARGAADGSREVLLLGSADLPASALADVWVRLVGALDGRPEIRGYGIMNEPHDLPGGARGWEAASAAAVRAVRAAGSTTPVLVGGYAYSGIAGFASLHPVPWVDASLGPVTYEAHQYFDPSRSGAYAEPYGAALADATAAGWTPCGSPAPS